MTEHEKGILASDVSSDYSVEFGILLFVCWMLSLSSFYWPGRSSPRGLFDLDWIAVIKIVSRILSTFLLGIAVYRMRHTGQNRKIIRCLFPFAIFVLWAMISTLWSPLKAISLGHSVELLMLVMLSIVCAATCYNTQRVSKLFLHLSLIALMITFMALILRYKLPSTNISVSDLAVRPFAIAHPNVLAAIAGLGMVILLLSSSVWRWGWARIMLPLSLIVEGFFLVISVSRIAIAATSITVVTIFLLFKKRLVVTLVIVLFSLTAMALLSTGWLYTIIENLIAYLMRGQDMELFLSGSGRLELWKKGFNFFLHSPFFGNGYFAFSPSGFIDLGGELRPYGAHNFIMHLLTGTGIIGLILFVWGIYLPIRNVFRKLSITFEERKIAKMVLIIFSWFFLQGMFEVSFLGPVDLTSIVFFVTLGFAARP